MIYVPTVTSVVGVDQRLDRATYNLQNGPKFDSHLIPKVIIKALRRKDET